MQTWMRLGIGVAAIALAVAAGTAAYAMRGDNDAPNRDVVAEDGNASPQGDDQGAGAFAAICAEGQPECDDTVDAPLDSAARCTPEFPDCDDTIGVPLGDFAEYPCDAQGGVTILPAPIDEPVVTDPALTDPAVSEPAEDLPLVLDPAEGGPEAAPELTDEEIARLEDIKAREQAAACPPVECVPGPAVDCGPIDSCVPGPAVDCGPVDCVVGPDGACLAPDCAVSSDGSISCPTDVCVLPAPDLPEETIIERCQAGCSSPGFDPGASDNEPAVDAAIDASEALDPCLVEPSTGAGTDGVPPSTQAGEPEPAPVE